MLRNRALTAAAAGDLTAALELAEEAFELTSRLEESVLSSWAAMVVARAAVMSGRSERAVEVIGRGEAADVLHAIPGAWRAMGLESLVRAYVELDRADAAESVTLEVEAHAGALGLPLGLAWARRARAAVTLHANEPAAAASHALASAAAAEEAGAVIEAALSRMLAGRALSAAGDDDGAGREFERAAATFGACGALPHRNAAEQELRRLGRRIHRRTRPGATDTDGLSTLTERELQLAELVADRRTNPEIAAELFLSLKTVESHLRNIFRKLGVSSRVELARAVERARRDP
jgi:DNA-binding NarL/FixJ family response regulator